MTKDAGQILHFEDIRRRGESATTLRSLDKSKNKRSSYGLVWNPNPAGQGHLLSASEDTTICHWDIKAYSKANSVLEPLRIYRGHSSVVEDVAWHTESDDVFASVGDDKQLMM